MLKKSRKLLKKLSKISFAVVTLLGPWLSTIANTGGQSID